MAATQLANKHGNNSTVNEHWCVSGLTIVNSAILTTYFSVPIPQNTCVNIQVQIQGIKSDYILAISGSLSGVFSRGTGNIIQLGNTLLSLINNFSGVKPSVVLSANISTQSIDIIITSAPTYTVNWTAHFNLNYNI